MSRKPMGYWNYERCEEEAKKYNNKIELRKCSNGAYQAALKNGWLNDYTWFEEKQKPNGYWNIYEHCYEEAKKYNSRGEFAKGCTRAYDISRRNNWLDDYYWLERKNNPFKNNMHNVYAYFFEDFHAVYVGLTDNLNRRKIEHNNQKNSAVHKFAKEHGLPIPQMTILEENISMNDSLIKEDFYVKKYKEEGWNVLNKAKTGLLSGSIGGNVHKWTKNKCYKEAKKYKTRTEFQKGNPSAYTAAWKNGWLDDYDWFIEKQKPNGYWTKERCYEEAKKYTTRMEFKNGCSRAYTTSIGSGWINDYDWFIEKHKPKNYWTKERCYEEAKKYNNISDFIKGNGSAYQLAKKHEWTQDYTWLVEKIRPMGYWNKYEHCYEEAKKYQSKSEFQKGNGSAYDAARKNGWLNKFFPIDMRIKKTA